MRKLLVIVVGAVALVAASNASGARASQPVHEVTVMAKKFGFEPPEIRVVAGEQVRLVVRSADSVHGFAIPDLKIDLTVAHGGDPVVAEFTAPPAGRYEIACSEFCGRGHAQMKAALVSAVPLRD